MKGKMSEGKRAWTWEEGGRRVVRGVARTGPGCHEGCGVLLSVKDGKLVKVTGDPEFPLNRGRLCPRCLALLFLLMRLLPLFPFYSIRLIHITGQIRRGILELKRK